MNEVDGQETPYVSELPSGKPVSLAVVEAVASVSGRSPLLEGTADGADEGPLDPLYEVIDPDALDALCLPDDARTTISFTYCGYDVTVESTGRITVTEG